MRSPANLVEWVWQLSIQLGHEWPLDGIKTFQPYLYYLAFDIISCCRIECESEPLLSITFRGQPFFFIFKGWWYSMELYKQSVASSKTKSIVGSKDSPFIGELGPGYKIKNYSIPTFPDCIIFPSLQIQFWLECFLCRKKVGGPIGERGYKNKWNFTFNWYHLM